MSYIILPSDQQAVISDVDEAVLLAAVRQGLDEGRVGPIHGLGLSACEPYVAIRPSAHPVCADVPSHRVPHTITMTSSPALT
jgi:hypothetical protein